MFDRPLYVDRIMAFVDAPFIKILTGVRRCGKSTILKLIMKRLVEERGIAPEQIVSYRFDSMEYDGYSAREMYALLKGALAPQRRTYLFLDEVQEIEGWEKVVNSLATDFDVDIYLTGSNSRMMSSEIATYLTGRYVAFRIYTLSFGEYLFFKSHYAEVGDPKQELAEYVRLGGFPGTHLQAYSQDEVYTIVRDIYNSTVFSDIVRRNQIKKVDQLERVVKYVFNNVGNTFSASSISAYLKSERRSLDNDLQLSGQAGERVSAASLLTLRSARESDPENAGKILSGGCGAALQCARLQRGQCGGEFGKCCLPGIAAPWLRGVHWQNAGWRSGFCGDAPGRKALCAGDAGDHERENGKAGV